MNNDQQTNNVPEEVTKPRKMALCLSGGGYRAALFHLGVLRRLNELGLLTSVDTITSVSGGSILAAHLAACYGENPPAGGRYPDWESRVAEPFRRFCQRDIRTVPVLKRFLLPWNWPRRSTQVNALMHRYEKYLTKFKLSDLPKDPEFVFCATDLVFGKNWEFKRDKVGDYKTRQVNTPEGWTVARAVAASSCFPPVFDPMRVGEDLLREKADQVGKDEKMKRLLRVLRLSDGGVYDNLGLEPVKNHYTVLVSDGGAPFRVFTAKSPFRLLKRYFDITSDQVGSLRKRWLYSDFNTTVEIEGKSGPKKQGAVMPIGKGSTDKDDDLAPGYEDKLVESHISRIRTDLDGFTDEEIGILENHGYLMANRVLKKYCRHLVDGDWPSLATPHPEMFDKEWVKKQLERSSSRLSLSRIIKVRKQRRAHGREKG